MPPRFQNRRTALRERQARLGAAGKAGALNRRSPAAQVLTQGRNLRASAAVPGAEQALRRRQAAHDVNLLNLSLQQEEADRQAQFQRQKYLDDQVDRIASRALERDRYVAGRLDSEQARRERELNRTLEQDRFEIEQAGKKLERFQGIASDAEARDFEARKFEIKQSRLYTQHQQSEKRRRETGEAREDRLGAVDYSEDAEAFFGQLGDPEQFYVKDGDTVTDKLNPRGMAITRQIRIEQRRAEAAGEDVDEDEIFRRAAERQGISMGGDKGTAPFFQFPGGEDEPTAQPATEAIPEVGEEITDEMLAETYRDAVEILNDPNAPEDAKADAQAFIDENEDARAIAARQAASA